jgi:hypothetical protein
MFLLDSIVRGSMARVLGNSIAENAATIANGNPAAILGTIQNRHRELLTKIEAAGGAPFRDFAARLLAVLGPVLEQIAVMILTAWLDSLFKPTLSPVPIPSAPALDSEVTRDFTPKS